MLRLLNEDRSVEVRVKDALERIDEAGTREWSGRISLRDIIAAGDKPIVLSLTKEFTLKQNFLNKMTKKLSLQFQKIIGSYPTKILSKQDEILKIKLQFSIFKDLL